MARYNGCVMLRHCKYQMLANDSRQSVGAVVSRAISWNRGYGYESRERQTSFVMI